MFKKAFLLFIQFAVFFSLSSQTGPAGVGTSANNVLWLKADAGTSSTTNSVAITSWNDQSGNGVNVTQTVSAQQPSFATSVINGFPAVQFDNSTTANQNDKLIGPDSPLLDNTSGYTFFHVTRPMNFGDAHVILSKRTGVAIDQSFMLFYYTSNKLNIDIQTNDNRFASNTTYATATNYIGCLTYDGTIATSGLRCTLYNEETFDKNAAETNTFIPDNNSPLLIGTTDASDPRPFGGYMSEIIMYREALGTAQRIIVNNYLSAKYNIALSANDKYLGDNAGNGDYDREVAGIGQEATGSNPSFSASVSGGLTMSVNSGLDNSDYILAGHAVPVNTTITTDVGGMTGSNKARWQRIWYVDVTNSSTNLNIDIEFDMSDGGMAPFTLGALSNYVLLYRVGQTGNWLEVATASSISGDRVIFNSIGATGDGYMTLGTRDFNNSPLPIQLLDFSALPKGQGVELSWSTASEKNNNYFTLEKSQDGETFESFAKIKGAGTSSQLHQYKNIDLAPYSGTSYYRLKQTDEDDKITYSDILALTLNNKEDALLLFPNPNNGDFKIRFPDSGINEIEISLQDVSGKDMLSGVKVTKGEDGFYVINYSSFLRNGIYTIIIFSGQKKYNRKLIIK